MTQHQKNRKFRWMKIKYALVCLTGKRHVRYLRKQNLFGMLGENVLFQPIKLPNSPQRIKIHNNVKVAADVTFYEHDVINSLFAKMDGKPYSDKGTCIEIYDNVFIGGRSVIVGNVSIGPNAIVSAGSVVTQDVPPGTIVAGNPARVIGSFEELHQRRMQQFCEKPDETNEECWNHFYEHHGVNEQNT